MLPLIDDVDLEEAAKREKREKIHLFSLGLISVVLVMVGSLQVQSPFTLKQPCAWFYGVPTAPCSEVTVPLGKPSQLYFLAITAVYSGLFIFMRVWISLVRFYQRRPGSSPAFAVACFIAWSLPLMFAPPLFSRDAYAYAGQGELVARGFNPYVYGTSVLGPPSSNPYIDQVDPLWLKTPNPYGPLDLLIAGLLTEASGHQELVNVVLLRIVMGFLGMLIACYFLPYLARALKRDPAETMAVAVCNPLVVFHLVGGIHNDGLMTGLMFAGLALIFNGAYFLGAAVLAVSGLVKASSLLVLPFVGFYLAGPGASLKERIRVSAKLGVWTLLAMEVLTLGTNLGWGWVKNLGTPATVRSWLAPSTGLGILMAKICSGLDVLHSIDVNTWINIFRAFGLLVGVAVILWLLFRVDRFGFIDAAGAALVVSVVASPVVQPWYLVWGVCLLALSSRSWIRLVVLVLSIVSTFLTLPGGRGLLHELITAPKVLVVPYVVVLFVVLAGPFLARYWRQAGAALSSATSLLQAAFFRGPSRRGAAP